MTRIFLSLCCSTSFWKRYDLPVPVSDLIATIWLLFIFSLYCGVRPSYIFGQLMFSTSKNCWTIDISSVFWKHPNWSICLNMRISFLLVSLKLFKSSSDFSEFAIQNCRVLNVTKSVLDFFCLTDLYACFANSYFSLAGYLSDFMQNFSNTANISALSSEYCVSRFLSKKHICMQFW